MTVFTTGERPAGPKRCATGVAPALGPECPYLPAVADDTILASRDRTEAVHGKSGEGSSLARELSTERAVSDSRWHSGRLCSVLRHAAVPLRRDGDDPQAG